MRDLEERKFQKVDENIATGIAPAGIDGFSEERNDGYSCLPGYSQDELRQIQFFSLTHPGDLDEIKQRMTALLGGRELKARTAEVAGRRGAVALEDRSRPGGGGDVRPQQAQRGDRGGFARV
jgi:PAS domain S-box-containing protein